MQNGLTALNELKIWENLPPSVLGKCFKCTHELDFAGKPRIHECGSFFCRGCCPEREPCPGCNATFNSTNTKIVNAGHASASEVIIARIRKGVDDLTQVLAIQEKSRAAYHDLVAVTNNRLLEITRQSGVGICGYNFYLQRSLMPTFAIGHSQYGHMIYRTRGLTEPARKISYQDLTGRENEEGNAGNQNRGTDAIEGKMNIYEK
ncbi:Oidioi.mRNA.OKI2018_I69.YSR.g17079.t1.cds [Oikopleura dioica]|uniref:Oidioi.mRNA.OKI2018_I69.YSR.g17069.t1.cds n=1 Tax=Oikopleura dioica TaxID=34765 RepID=A0ABN7SQD9_OIKDI|nr:Oidioi.mRNA.OKI2018_I69.YSR.g17069.t1.cds [Oikopleura dioica]CAG5101428.1 Oidioi.mRNA.OKI2018_I69.YSR.g17079.t1.cds [Oikopleura dioica]